MYAYCNNNPVNFIDKFGEKTVSISTGVTAYLFVGGGYSRSVSFDGDGNFALQETEAGPGTENGGGYFGFIGTANGGVSFAITTLDTVNQLNGYSSYIGGETVDIILNDKYSTADKVIGTQISFTKGTPIPDYRTATVHTRTVYADTTNALPLRARLHLAAVWLSHSKRASSVLVKREDNIWRWIKLS